MKNESNYILGRIAKLMARTKVKYAILGGVAVSLYGVPRLTLDVDVNIILGKDRAVDFLKEAHRLGFASLVRNERKFMNSTGVIPMKLSKGAPFRRCDFIIAQNVLEHLAIERARTKTIGSCKIKVVTPEDLILHKLVSNRPRDIEDGRGIIMRQTKLDIGYIRFWMRKISGLREKPDLLKTFDSLLRVR